MKNISKKYFFILVLILIVLGIIYKNTLQSFNAQKAYLFIVQTSNIEEVVHTNCKLTNLSDQDETYNQKVLNDHKEEYELKVPYVTNWTEKDDSLSYLQNVGKKHNFSKTYIEGFIWTHTEEKCRSLIHRIKTLAQLEANNDYENRVKNK